MPLPFEVGFDEVRSNLDVYVDAVFGCLESEFLVMPKGDGFVEFSVFETGYEALKRATGSFREVTPDTVAPVVFETPIALIVLRCMLGFTPPEWAYYASRHTGVNVTQSAARTIDRSIRMKPDAALSRRGYEFPDKPSRLTSAFTCEHLDAIRFFKEENCSMGIVYEVELVDPDANRHTTDFGCIQPIPGKLDDMCEIARHYWRASNWFTIEGRPGLRCAETLVETGLRVVREVDLT